MEREEFAQFLRNEPHEAAMALFDRMEAVEHSLVDLAAALTEEPATKVAAKK